MKIIENEFKLHKFSNEEFSKFHPIEKPHFSNFYIVIEGKKIPVYTEINLDTYIGQKLGMDLIKISKKVGNYQAKINKSGIREIRLKNLLEK